MVVAVAQWVMAASFLIAIVLALALIGVSVRLYCKDVYREMRITRVLGIWFAVVCSVLMTASITYMLGQT